VAYSVHIAEEEEEVMMVTVTVTVLVIMLSLIRIGTMSLGGFLRL